MSLDWQPIFLNLRRAGMSSNALKRRVGMDIRTVSRFQRGELKEPKFSQGLEILKLHAALCPREHEETVYDKA